MAIVLELVSIVLPVFIIAGIGVVWTRTGQPFDSDLVSTLVYKIGAPCLIIATFSKVHLTPDAVVEVAGAAMTVYVLTALAAAAILRAARLPLPSYLPSMMFPLVGSMGLPVCLFAYGEDGLALALVYFTLSAMGTFTIGAAIAAGTASWGKLVREPAIWAAVVAVALLWFDVNPPKWIVDTAGLLGGMTIPLQLLSLGCSLGEFRIASLPRGVALSLLRLGLGFGLGLAVAETFGLQGTARAVVILQSAMPVAVSNYMFAMIYKRAPADVAGLVLISTAISFATLPLLLFYLR